MNTIPMARWHVQRSWPALCAYLLLVDIGLLLYWLVAMADILPPAWLFKGYHDPVISAWNWSFLPLDVLASLTGLAGIAFTRQARTAIGESLILVSLSLTFCAGLMALSFWALTADYDLSWWAANAFLMVPSGALIGARLRDMEA